METYKNKSPYFTPKQLSDRWGVTVMTIRRWRKAGKLKNFKLGRGIRFTLEEVERFESRNVDIPSD